MAGSRRRLSVPAALAAAAALVVASPGTASADDTGGIGDVIERVQERLQPVTEQSAPRDQQRTAASPSSNVPAPASDDDLAGHETKDPAPPDHGSGQVADVDLADNDVADVAHSTGTTEDDDSTRSDATLLALGGQEVLGAHADSEGTTESHAGDPLAPLCEGSGGQLCLTVLYADAWATDDGSSSHADSRTGVASVCAGGTDTDATDCDGPVGAGVATSSGTSDRNQATGRTTASSASDVADACLAPDATTGACALGVGVLHSSGDADSGGSAPSAHRESYLLALDAGGQERGRVDQPTEIAIQPTCATPSLVCAYLNQGETYLGEGVAGHAQEALDARVLPETPLEIGVELARSETLAHNDGGDTVPTGDGGQDEGVVAGEHVSAGGPGQPASGVVAGVVAGVETVLPNTGGVGSGLLAGGLLAVGTGCLLLAARRRRTLLS